MSRERKGKKKEQVGGVTWYCQPVSGRGSGGLATHSDGQQEAAIACYSESLRSKLQWKVSRDLSASWDYPSLDSRGKKIICLGFVSVFSGQNTPDS